MVRTASGLLLCVFRTDGGDGAHCPKCDSGCRGPCAPFHATRSSTEGHTWSQPELLFTAGSRLPMGSVLPRLVQLEAGPLLLTGGRNCARNGARCDTLAATALVGTEAGTTTTILCPANCGGVGAGVCTKAVVDKVLPAAGGWLTVAPNHTLRAAPGPSSCKHLWQNFRQWDL